MHTSGMLQQDFSHNIISLEIEKQFSREFESLKFFSKIILFWNLMPKDGKIKELKSTWSDRYLNDICWKISLKIIWHVEFQERYVHILQNIRLLNNTFRDLITCPSFLAPRDI